MSIIDCLQIYLITYNRKKQLTRTLNQILAQNSPIKDFDITILDNASTDGSSELIDEYCQKFPNLIHIRHKVNIGGNANICRAFELGASCQKEYVWVLCDDDFFDFDNFKELEERILCRDEMICVSDYIFPNEESRKSLAYQMIQCSFVPSIIVKSENISQDVLINMYDSILISFPQLSLVAKCINEKKKIHVLSKPIVTVGYLVFDDEINEETVSLTRGMQSKWCLDRRKKSRWVGNYAQAISLLNDKMLQKESLEYSLTAGIDGKWHYFLSKLFNFDDFNYFYETFKELRFKLKVKVLLSRVIHTYTTSKDVRLYFFGLKFKIFPKIKHNAMGGGDLPIQQK